MGIVEERLQVVKTAMEIGIGKAAIFYGLDRKTVASWVKKFNNLGITGLENSSKINYNNPETMPEEIVQQIIEFKQQHPESSANQIKTHFNLTYSLTAINKKIRQAGLQTVKLQPDFLTESAEYFLTVHPVSNLDDYKYFIGLTNRQTGLVIPGYAKESNISVLIIFLHFFHKRLNPGNKAIIYHNLTYLNKKQSTTSFIKQIGNIELFYKCEIEHPPYKKNHTTDVFKLLAEQNFQLNTILATVWLLYNCNLQTSVSNFDYHQANIYSLNQDNDEKEIIDSLITAFNAVSAYCTEKNNQDLQFLVYEILIKLTEKSVNSNLHITTIQKKAQLFQKKGQHNEALKLLKIAETLALKCQNDLLYAKNCGIYGTTYQQTGKYSQAARFFNLQHEISSKIGNQEELCQVCLNLGVLYSNQGSYKKARTFYNQALELAQITGKKNIRLTVLGNIGVIFWHQNKLKDAQEYFKAAYTMATDLNNQRQIARMLGNLGAVYDQMYQYSTAREYYQKQLAIAEINSNASLRTAALSNLGSNYLVCGETKEALAYLRSAYELSNQTEDLEKQIIILGELAVLYQKINELKLADEYIKKALKVCSELNDSYYCGGFYLQLAELDFRKGNFKSAVKYNSIALQLLIAAHRENLIIESKLLTINTNLKTAKIDSQANCLFELETILNSSRSAECKALVRQAMVDLCFNQLSPEKQKEIVNKLITFNQKMYSITSLKFYNAEIIKLRTLTNGE